MVTEPLSMAIHLASALLLKRQPRIAMVCSNHNFSGNAWITSSTPPPWMNWSRPVL
jgi:hypothetical protein